MNKTQKKILLEYILNSNKIKSKYKTFRYKYRLNKELIAKTVLLESNQLFKKFKDIEKLSNFLESYIVNHITNFLILRNKDTDNFSKDTNNTGVISNDLENYGEDEDPNDRFKRQMEERRNENVNVKINEENNQEKNEMNNLETDMNRLSYNPYINAQQQPMANQMQPMNNQMQPMANQMQPMNNQMQPMANQMQPMNNQMQPMANQMQPMNNQMQPMNNQMQPMANPQNNRFLKKQPPPVLPPQNEINQTVKEEKLVRSLIHIDTRDRDFNKKVYCNPIQIIMDNNITCLVNIRDLIMNNNHRDPYLLIQIMESNKGLYENQLGKEVHFKLLKSETTKDNTYYRNIDNETMIRLRNIEEITFSIIRPNGQVLYSNIKDIQNINEYPRDKLVDLLNSTDSIIQINDKLAMIDLNDYSLEEGDLVSLFNRDLENSCDFKVICILKTENKVILEALENRKEQIYEKMLINKYQISITLEII